MSVIFIFGFSYLILCLQVFADFPPFYDSKKRFSYAWLRPMPFLENDLRVISLALFSIMALLVLSVVTHWSGFLGGAGAVCVGLGLWLRRNLSNDDDRVFHMSWPQFVFLNEWPKMWLFDLWTIGYATGFALLTHV